MDTALTPRVLYRKVRLWLAMKGKYRPTEQGFSLIEFLLVVALVVAALSLTYFFFSKARASSDLNNIEQSISSIVSAIENAKSSNGGAYPSGTISNLGSFQIPSSVTPGNTAPSLLGSILCPSVPAGGTCTNAILNQWQYSCTASSNGGTSNVQLTIYIPPQNTGIINSVINYFQNSYSGWTCSSGGGSSGSGSSGSSNNTIICTLSNVICQ